MSRSTSTRAGKFTPYEPNERSRARPHSARQQRSGRYFLTCNNPLVQQQQRWLWLLRATLRSIRTKFSRSTRVPRCCAAAPSTTVLQGRAARRGYLVTRLTVTLSIFNFSTRFFAQIVENRETQLSSHFLGPGDNFSKSYDENQIWSNRVYARAGLMRRSQMPYSCHTNRFSS
jgi:hypothetical protein